MLTKQVLEITGIECYAYHGCMPEETKIGGRYTVDVILDLDVTDAVFNDQLNDTADYLSIYTIVTEEMKIPSRLIEHVAGRIMQRIKNLYSKTNAAEVRVHKHNPPVNGAMQCATIILQS